MEEITHDDVMATYKVLEYIRDESSATDDEKSVVNNAHAVVQEAENWNVIPKDQI